MVPRKHRPRKVLTVCLRGRSNHEYLPLAGRLHLAKLYRAILGANAKKGPRIYCATVLKMLLAISGGILKEVEPAIEQ